MTRTSIPSYAHDLPEIAQTLDHIRLPFYCTNCYRKRETTYLTPDFGPFCDECLKELIDAQTDAVTNAVDEFIRGGDGTYDELQAVVARALKA